MTTKVNTITRNYNGDALKPGEVLVPIPYDAAFVKANCTNPECIRMVSVGGRHFKALYIAVPESCVAAVRNSFNLYVNEKLGHYRMKDSVSLDYLLDDYECDFATVPSPEDQIMKQQGREETTELFVDLIHHLIERSPKYGFATLLLMSGSKGADFHEKMHLSHDAANTVRKQTEDFLKMGLANIDMDKVSTKKSKNTDYYREQAYRLLDTLVKLYNA